MEVRSLRGIGDRRLGLDCVPGHQVLTTIEDLTCYILEQEQQEQKGRGTEAER